MKHEKAVAGFRPYIREVADQMQLRDWQIFVSNKRAGEGRRARVFFPGGRKVATIWLSKNFLRSAPEEQRQTVCHELCHLHFAPMHTPTWEALPEAARPFYVNALELGVDALAEVLAPFLPLPPVQGEPRHE